jgi:subtilisin-like proprotein convertase family protein
VLAACLVTASAAHAAAPPVPAILTVTGTNTDGDAAIPDNDSLISTIVIADAPGVLVDVDVTLDIEHTQPDQLDVYLVSPGGTAVTLTTDNGGGNDGIFSPVTFDDQAPGTPSAATVRNAVFTNGVPLGTVQPEEALGELIGEQAEGQWALVVTDDSGGQQGTLHGWSIAVSTVPGVGGGAPVVVHGAGRHHPGHRRGRRARRGAGVGARHAPLPRRAHGRHPPPARQRFSTSSSPRRAAAASTSSPTSASRTPTCMRARPSM